VVAVGDGNQLDLHQRIGEEPGRNLPGDDQVGTSLQQRLGGAGEHRLDELDARFRRLRAELGQAAEHQFRRRDVVDREAHLALPALGQRRREPFQLCRVLEQPARPPQQHLAVGGQRRPAPARLEHGDRELGLQPLECVADRRLAAVERLGGGLETAAVDDRLQSRPLLQRGSRGTHGNISIFSINKRRLLHK
jgi:hypothetical protein